LTFHQYHHQQQQQNQFQDLYSEQMSQQYIPTAQELYGDLPVNVHPSRAWQPPIPASKVGEADNHDEDNELTVFHAKVPYQQRDAAIVTSTPRGVSHWGPDLLEYLQDIVSRLGVTDDGIEIPLAMIYMDRACSVETPRSNNVQACPFCTPRTVHRLSLAALWIATEAVHGNAGERRMKESMFQQTSDTNDDSNNNCSLSSSSLGLSEEELQQMLDWMRAALGDHGLMVTVEQMRCWSQSWESIFSTSVSSRYQRL
jgi:hypothetical protein